MTNPAAKSALPARPHKPENSPPEAIAGELLQFTYFRGRVALAAILRALGVQIGDEVLIQAFTCIAVPEAILSVGAKPVYVDVEAGGINMDPADLDKKISPNTRAVVAQHSFGLPANISRITEIAEAKGIPVVEDCAHTIMSRVNGKRVGSFGHASFYSYEAAKPVFVGIGGSAVCNDDALERAVRAGYTKYAEPPVSSQLETAAMFHAHGIAYQPSTYWTVRSMFRTLSAAGLIRGNYNKIADQRGPASDFTRRMGRIQKHRLRQELRGLTAQSDHRREVSTAYRTRIRSSAVHHIDFDSGVDPVYGRYPLLTEQRASLVREAQKARVEVAVFYDSAVQPLYGEALRSAGYEPGSCPNAEWASERIISLPTGRQVGRREIDRSVDFLNAFGEVQG